MKRIVWTIGVHKPQGNVIQDGILHYNEPKVMQLDGNNLTPDMYIFSDDFDGTSYSDTLGFLDFTPIGGLFNGQKLLMIW